MRRARRCSAICRACPGLPPKTFKQAIEEKAGVLIDTRTMLGFGGGHIAGALNIGGTPMLSIWAGWLLDPDKPLLLVLDSDADLEKVVKLFIRTGYTKFAGYLAGGMKSWDNAGFELADIDQKTVHEVTKANGALADHRCSRAQRMESRTCAGRAAYFPAGAAGEGGRARSSESRLPSIATAVTAQASPPAS